MRPLFIAGVALATLLTFCSAFWYKSENITADITTRITDNLTQAGAKDVAIHIDGRHVTLSGVVYDTTTKSAYLDAADETYGALGPIDGLTLRNGAGFLKAVKTPDGITLTGAIPSDAARASLLEAAAASTEGEVVDAMTVGAVEGVWTDEASFGLAQMSQMSSGSLAATPDSYTLSGTTEGDATPLRQFMADREGWQAFISAPTVETGLATELTGLRSDIAERDKTIVKVTSERDTLATSLAAMTLARDTAEQQGAASTATVTVERDAAVSDLEKLRASLSDTQSDTTTLRGELSGAQEELAAANSDLEAKGAIIADLTGQVTDLTATNTALTQELETQKASLSSDQQEGNAAIAALNSNLTDATNASSGQTDTLKAEVTARDEAIVELDKSRIAAEEAKTAALGQVETLTQTLQARDGEVADLTARLADQSSNGTQTAAEMAALSGQVATLEASNSALSGEIANLNTAIATRDATITDLSSSSVATPTASTPLNLAVGSTQFAAQCSARAGEVLENAKINFSSGTARIKNNSVETLERLTGIAIACADSGLTVEIGGHTDSQGSDENNQALSESRATAIADFMSARGVPAETLKPVGYGEAQPVGDNATPAGRAQNRRISFEWKIR